MATVYADAGGAILRFLRSRAELATWPDPPAGAAFTVPFDETTNAPLVALFDTAWSRMSAPAGVISVDGAAYAVAPPGHAYEVDQFLVQHAAGLNSIYAQIAAQSGTFLADLQAANAVVQAWLGGTPPTHAQLLSVVKVMLRVMVFEASG